MFYSYIIFPIERITWNIQIFAAIRDAVHLQKQHIIYFQQMVVQLITHGKSAIFEHTILQTTSFQRMDQFVYHLVHLIPPLDFYLTFHIQNEVGLGICSTSPV